MAAEPGGEAGAEEDGGEEDGETEALGATDVTGGDTPATLPALVAAGLVLPARKATAPTTISTTSAATPISMPRRLVRRGGRPGARGGSASAASPPRQGSGGTADPAHGRSPWVGCPS